MGRKKNRYRYWDTKAKKFVKQSTYNRSKAQGGTRYKRKRVSVPTKPPIKRIPPAPELHMFRVTIAATYYVRSMKTANRKGGSPASAAYVARGWYSTFARAVAAQDSLTERAEAGRDDAVDEIKRAYDQGDDPDIEIRTVPFDERFINVIEEVNEK